ncbi:MAG TPA: hypothetical protein VIF15_09045 [Polyangiaceae bacterium]
MRRTLLALLACAAPGGLAVAVACNDGGRVNLTITDATAEAAGDDAGDDGSPDAAEELAIADQCGPSPWVTLGIFVVGLTLSDPDGSPLPGASFTSPLCPGLVQYTDDAGLIQGQVSANVPFYGRLKAQNFISELAPEELFDADSTGHKIEMLPTILEGILLPTFDASASTAIVIAAQKLVDDAGPCSAFDGIAFSVPGHPEATVTYFTNDTIPAPIANGTMTSVRGLAAVTGLAANQMVTLAGTKIGCTVVFQHDTLTGRVPLETGYVSLMAAYVGP